MNKNAAHIERLRNIIYNSLDSLIQNNYCLLDIPNHKNIGDNLIWAGELAFLNRLQHKMLYSSNMYVCDFDKIPAGCTILMHGGGNFGDVWRTSQQFRNSIIQHFKQNKIIVFPQTVHYTNADLLKYDAELFAAHKNIILCARDNNSYAVLKEHFSTNTILLVPDMAFCLDFSEDIISKKTGRKLLMRRTDKELNNKIDTQLHDQLADEHLEIKDWPTYNHTRQHEWIYNVVEDMQNKFAKNFYKTPVVNKLIDHRYGLKSRNNLNYFVREGVDFINQYDEIFSTRLHGAILSVLLNKKTHIIDNSYGKNKNFYNTWLTQFQETFLISN
jgi:exopolysaccharide biosynthesis predicted pyruvyltransferase EpsI